MIGERSRQSTCEDASKMYLQLVIKPRVFLESTPCLVICLNGKVSMELTLASIERISSESEDCISSSSLLLPSLALGP